MTQQRKGRQNGAAIRAFRKKEGLSVEQLAGALRLKHPQSLRNIENGRNPASREVMWLLTCILDVPMAAITRDGSDEPYADDAKERAPEDEGTGAAAA